MMSYCLIFPGQGTQFVGMSSGLGLDDVSDARLVDLMERGPEDKLRQTTNAQRAVFAVTSELWEQSGLNHPDMVMGHSLGEYMALVSSGAISKNEAMTLVSKRASLMEQAFPDGNGGMAAVIGMSTQDVSSIIESMSDVWVANINGAGQVVISGNASSIRKSIPRLKENGARRVVPLEVAVASHCPYMEPARKALREYLNTVKIERPLCRVIFNATAREESTAEKIKDLLAQQLISPVRWEESVRYAAKCGIKRFIEIGPRSVLAPLVKRILPDAILEVITQNAH